jgi:hypothetical protein
VAVVPHALGLQEVLEGFFVLDFLSEDVLDQVEGLDILVVTRTEKLHDVIVDIDASSLAS